MTTVDCNHQGIKVYRFQPCYEKNTGELRASKISPQNLWFSKPMMLNDPMDIDHPLDDLMQADNGDSPVLREMAKVMYRHGQNQFPKSFITDDLLEKIRFWAENDGVSLDICRAFRVRMLELGVACFTQDWNNPPMWAHYAADWQGFVIEYCIHQLEIAADSKNNGFWAFWVNYSSRIEQTSISELLFSPYEAACRILSAKTLPWSYENEWRLIHLPSGNCAVPIPCGMEMTGIILGPKSPAEQTELFFKKCTEWSLPLRRITVGLDKNLYLSDNRRVGFDGTSEVNYESKP